MRLFVALFPDTATRGYFRDLKQGLNKYKRNFSFTANDQIHLTLKFLGNNIKESVYEEYSSRLKEALQNYHQFTYKVGPVNFGFPGQYVPKTLFSKVNDCPELNDLTDHSSYAAQNIDFHDIIAKKDHKKLIHHFTIARIKTNLSKAFAREFREVLSNIAPPNFESTATEVAIVLSEISPKGSTYKVLERFPLVANIATEPSEDISLSIS